MVSFLTSEGFSCLCDILIPGQHEFPSLDCLFIYLFMFLWWEVGLRSIWQIGLQVFAHAKFVCYGAGISRDSNCDTVEMLLWSDDTRRREGDLRIKMSTHVVFGRALGAVIIMGLWYCSKQSGSVRARGEMRGGRHYGGKTNSSSDHIVWS